MHLIDAMQLGQLTGLMFRRRKWHLAEYNRIVATADRLPSEQAAVACRAHLTAIYEIEALLKREEPNWGSERAITESYLEDAEPAPAESAGVGESILQETV